MTKDALKVVITCSNQYNAIMGSSLFFLYNNIFTPKGIFCQFSTECNRSIIPSNHLLSGLMSRRESLGCIGAVL